MSPLLDPEKKQKILSRAREVAQTTNRLRSGNAFCSLGVICDVSGVSDWDGDGNYDGEFERLPESVEAWLGVKQGELGLEWGELMWEVPELNDDGWTLSEIADLAEEQW